MADHSNDVKSKITINKNEEESIAKLSTLYDQGLTNKSKIDHSHLYNILTTLLCLTSAVCVGIIICYLVYVFC